MMTDTDLRRLKGAPDSQLRTEYALWSGMEERATRFAALCGHPYVQDIAALSERPASDCRTVLAALRAEATTRGIEL